MPTCLLLFAFATLCIITQTEASIYLSRKLHLDVVTEQEDALPGVDEDASVGVGRVESHRL